MNALITLTCLASALMSAPAAPTSVVAKYNGEGIEVRWFPPAPSDRSQRWAYKVERIDNDGSTLSITHMALQPTLNVATIRDRLGTFADAFIGAIAYGSEARRINAGTMNDALTNPVSRALILRFAVLYPSVAEILGWRRVDQDLQPSKAYTYRVIAVDRSKPDREVVLGEARAVAQASGVSSPKGVEVSQPAPDRLELRWSRDLAREQSEAIVRYIIYRREGAGEWVALNPGLSPMLASAPSSQSAYVDSTVLAGRTYQYALAAVDLAGRLSAKTSAPSIRVADQRASLPPLDLQVSLSGRDLSVTWLSAGLAPDTKEVEVLKVRQGGPLNGSREVLKVLGRVSAKSGVYRTRAPGLGYHEYAVRSVDGAGNRGPLSVSVGHHVDRALRLKTPSGVKARLTPEGKVEVSWRATPGTDASTYVVERRVLGHPELPVQISTKTLGVRDKRTLDHSPPLGGPPLSYRVRAVAPGSAQSAASPWVTLKDLRRAPRVFLAPLFVSPKGARLTWQVERSEVALGFQIQVQADNGPWRNLSARPLGPEVRTATDTQNMAPERVVRYRVQSLGGAPGEPIFSNSVSYRTAALTLETPSGLSGRCLPDGVELRWKADKSASSYEVQRAFGNEGFMPRAEVNAPLWTDQSTLKARRYRYRVIARHGSEVSAPTEDLEIICSAR